MSEPLFDLEIPPTCNAEGEDLRELVHRHLRRYPMLNAYEIARALRLPHPTGAGKSRVMRQLRLMEGDGETEAHPGARAPGDRRTTIRWIAT